MKGWCVVRIHDGDAGLTGAVAALQAAGLQVEAHGWASEPVPRPTPHVQVPCIDLEQAWRVLERSCVGHVALGGQIATE